MNSSFSSIFWTQFWQITLLIPAAVLLIRYVVPKRPHLGYGVLLLVLLKTIFPPIWDSPTGVVWELLPKFQSEQTTEQVIGQIKVVEKNGVEAQHSASNVSSAEKIRTSTSTGSSQISESVSPHPKLILVGLWFAGVLSLLGYIIGKRAQLLRFHRDTEIPASDELLELVEIVSAELGLVKIPKVLVTLHPTVPFASGFFKQVVVLPAHVAQKTDAQELKLILAHEMTHLRRGDTLVGLLQLFVQVVWWFHPLVYWLNREVRRVREECCDTDVVRRLNCQPARYAHCLLNMLELHQSLRPSTELVGLSPLEVTKKRMQNIMRNSSKERKKTAAVLSTLTLICFAFLILPASASSFVTPKVILGDLAPQDAMLVKNDARENKNKRKSAPPAKKKEPKSKSQPHDASLPEVGKEKSSPQESIAAHLEYQWARGNKYQYRIKIEAKHPTEVVTYIGESTFRVDAYAAGIPALSRLNSKFDKNVAAVSGVEVPTLAALETDNELSSPFLYSPGPRIPFGPSFRSSSLESSKPTGSNAHISPSTGNLPYLLGQLDDWVFPTLPTSLDKTTSIEFSKEITLTSPGNYSLSPFESSPVEKLLANIDIETMFTSSVAKEIQLSRSWHLATQEVVNGESRREISLVGTILLSKDDSFPNSASYTGKLVEREFNRELRIPLAIEILRINP